MGSLRRWWLGLVLVAGLGAAEPAPPPRISLAVCPFSADSGVHEATAANLAALLTATLSQQGEFVLLEREQWAAIMAEQQLREAGLTQTQRLVQAGQLLGAQLLVTGRVFEVGQQRAVIVQCISCETQQVVGTALRTAPEAPLPEMVAQLAAELRTQIQQHRSSLLPSTVTVAERVAQLHLPPPAGATPTLAIALPADFPAALRDALLPVLHEGFAAAGYALPEHGAERQVEVSGQLQPLAQVRGRRSLRCTITLRVAGHERQPAAEASGQRVFVDDLPGGTPRVAREVAGAVLLRLLPRLAPAPAAAP